VMRLTQRLLRYARLDRRAYELASPPGSGCNTSEPLFSKRHSSKARYEKDKWHTGDYFRYYYAVNSSWGLYTVGVGTLVGDKGA